MKNFSRTLSHFSFKLVFALLCFSLSGCVVTIQEESGSPGTPTSLPYLVELKGPANLSLPAGNCQQLQVAFEDSQNNPQTLGTDTMVVLSAANLMTGGTQTPDPSQGVQFFSDANCSEEISQFDVPAGDSSATVFFSGSTLGYVGLLASVTGTLDEYYMVSITAAAPVTPVSPTPGPVPSNSCVANGTLDPSGTMIMNITIAINEGSGPYTLNIGGFSAETDNNTFFYAGFIPVQQLTSNPITFVDTSNGATGVCALTTISNPVGITCPFGVNSAGNGCAPLPTPTCPPGYTAAQGICMFGGPGPCPAGYTYAPGIGCMFATGNNCAPGYGYVPGIGCALCNSGYTLPGQNCGSNNGQPQLNCNLAIVGPSSVTAGQPVLFQLVDSQAQSLNITQVSTDEAVSGQLPSSVPNGGIVTINWDTVGVHSVTITAQTSSGAQCTTNPVMVTILHQ